jgi:hypothetical protein
LTANLEKTRVLPKAITEKGLYMLATILKSPQATQATIAIVEAFAKLKELTNNIAILNSIDPEVIEPEIIESAVEKTGGLLNDLFFSGLPTSAETSVELNLGLIKTKRTIKSEPMHEVQARRSQNSTMQDKIDNIERMVLDLKNQMSKPANPDLQSVC